MYSKKYFIKNHPEFVKLSEARNKAMNKHCKYHNEHIVKLRREECELRESLPQKIAEERLEAEERIRDIKHIIGNDIQYQQTIKELDEIEAKYKEYIQNHLTYKEKINAGFFPSEGWYDLFTEEEIKQYEKDEGKNNNIFLITVIFIVIICMIVIPAIYGK